MTQQTSYDQLKTDGGRLIPQFFCFILTVFGILFFLTSWLMSFTEGILLGIGITIIAIFGWRHIRKQLK